MVALIPKASAASSSETRTLVSATSSIPVLGALLRRWRATLVDPPGTITRSVSKSRPWGVDVQVMPSVEYSRGPESPRADGAGASRSSSASASTVVAVACR
ncbi:hypothetical protein CFK39_06330 [Brachybacterium avium]|uniref:Uncharacterized protein n=1 Tax=Brachybacterium avium TaxID=2017485 RepID=A0A220UC47_9MICO|nr:hypothetical protein CFK39_06330 [Brachybacterium avium]